MSYYQRNIYLEINTLVYSIVHGDVDLKNFFEILQFDFILTFLPISIHTLNCDFLVSSLTEISYTFLFLLATPLIIIQNLLFFIFDGSVNHLLLALWLPFKAMILSSILAMEIFLLALSFITKPIITIGFMIASAVEFLFAQISKNYEAETHPNEQSYQGKHDICELLGY